MPSWLPWRGPAPEATPQAPAVETRASKKHARKRVKRQARDADMAAAQAALKPEPPAASRAWEMLASAASMLSAASLTEAWRGGGTAEPPPPAARSRHTGASLNRQSAAPNGLPDTAALETARAAAAALGAQTHQDTAAAPSKLPAVLTHAPQDLAELPTKSPKAISLDLQADALSGTLADSLTALRKGPATDMAGEVPAIEAARLVWHAQRWSNKPLRSLSSTIQRQARDYPHRKPDAAHPFADTAEAIWGVTDPQVRQWRVAFQVHQQLGSLDEALGLLAKAGTRHAQAEPLIPWVQANGPQRLRTLHAQVRDLHGSAAEGLHDAEDALKARLTAAYERGDPRACAFAPLHESVRTHAAQAALRFFNNHPEAQAMLADNSSWRQLVQLIHPALAFRHNVSGSPPHPQLVSLLLNMTPEEESIKINGDTWRLYYFKRGGEERAFVAHHLGSGTAALLFYDTKHVKEVNGSWSAAYDKELRKAVDKLRGVLGAA